MYFQNGWAVFLTIVCLSGCTGIPAGVTPINEFDKARYLGKWYEIARLDHSFERGLEQVTAIYSERTDGGISVLNQGFDPDKNAWKSADGKAYFVGEENIGHLKVSFFGPFYASYVIAKLDQENYQYALVTGPDLDYLWILARTPSLPEAKVQELLLQARQYGFDTSQLIFVNHLSQ